jgi:hypothetical protein
MEGADAGIVLGLHQRYGQDRAAGAERQPETGHGNHTQAAIATTTSRIHLRRGAGTGRRDGIGTQAIDITDTKHRDLSIARWFIVRRLIGLVYFR